MSLVLKIVKTELISQIDKYHLISLKCGIKKKRLPGFPGGSGSGEFACQYRGHWFNP